MDRILDHVDGADIICHDDGRAEVVEFIGNADIDNDGSGGNVGKDPSYQSGTTLSFQGRALNAQVVPFIAFPPVICRKTRGKVLGCHVWVTDTVTGKRFPAVAADIGPKAKLGEMSPALAKCFGINPDPVRGGDSRKRYKYEMLVGVPAVVNGITFNLQAYVKG